MLTISAIIRVKKGQEEVMKGGLLAVAENVRRHEPETIDFFVSQDPSDPTVFTTYERFVDQAAMDRHNNSATVASFYEIAKPILDGEGAVTLVKAQEIWKKG